MQNITTYNTAKSGLRQINAVNPKKVNHKSECPNDPSLMHCWGHWLRHKHCCRFMAFTEEFLCRGWCLSSLDKLLKKIN